LIDTVGRECNIGYRIVALASSAHCSPKQSAAHDLGNALVFRSTRGTLRKPCCARKRARLAGPGGKHSLRVTCGSLSSTHLEDVLKAHISPELVQWRGIAILQQRLSRITGQRGNVRTVRYLGAGVRGGQSSLGMPWQATPDSHVMVGSSCRCNMCLGKA
jgi:hypothetical protein